ncbi:hypothetical protein BDV28DRAFT_162499 [Aspergillus coremiiformis]|uniref:Uncharacterized protein n=1 Tax=Aspergillus coremiiformis TaxID=138285 RepID=A0A5N6Z5D2_9EURO|nr:hypothetical protein BDV28DRAFT_162499 [Aspergillus coremiiformis]
MLTHGLWNKRVNGKWYRSFDPQILSPGNQLFLPTIRSILSNTDIYTWQLVPFPTPLHMNLDYVYNIDQDTGFLTITQWDEVVEPLDRSLLIRRVKLTDVLDTPLSALNFVFQFENVEQGLDPTSDSLSDDQDEAWIFEPLEIGLEPPTPLNELQFLIFTHLVFTWRFYFDDILAWKYPSRLFNTLAFGLLRIAAWDFEVLLKNDTDEARGIFSSIPRWKAPAEDIFWFHGYLVVFCSPIETETTICRTVLRAKDYLSESNQLGAVIHTILISIQHVVLVEISNHRVSCSPPVPLVTNTSAIECSPGFRILAYMLSSYSWKGSLASREHWRVTLPPEIFDMMLKCLSPRDIVSFAQASFAVERWYYSSIPQLGGLTVQSFDLSVPCCGKRDSQLLDGIHCSICYAWYHVNCIGPDLNLDVQVNKFLCFACQLKKTCTSLQFGGIHQVYRLKQGIQQCMVATRRNVKVLRLRVNQPTCRLRPDLFLNSFRPVDPELINYTIYFGGVFSGLCYGLDCIMSSH